MEAMAKAYALVDTRMRLTTHVDTTSKPRATNNTIARLTVRACEGDVEVSSHAMAIPPTCSEATERPRAPAHVLVRPPAYAKD